ncbi:unnamed protein product [Brassica oleracea]
MLISFGFFFILPRFSKIFLTEGIHSVSEASRSINGREFICLYGKDSAEIVIKQPKRSHMFLKMIVLVFAMVCGLYICSVCLKQFSVQTSQLFRTRITTRIHYPKPETFNRFFVILSMQRSGSGGSSSNNRKPRRYRELASLFAKIIQEKPSNSCELKEDKKPTPIHKLYGNVLSRANHYSTDPNLAILLVVTIKYIQKNFKSIGDDCQPYQYLNRSGWLCDNSNHSIRRLQLIASFEIKVEFVQRIKTLA